MTALAQRITEPTMAPYIGLMQSMTRQDIDIVVTFLNEVKKDAEESKPKSNEEIIREKYKNLHISPRVKALVDGLSLSKEEVDDERTKYMLGIYTNVPRPPAAMS